MPRSEAKKEKSPITCKELQSACMAAAEFVYSTIGGSTLVLYITNSIYSVYTQDTTKHVDITSDETKLAVFSVFLLLTTVDSYVHYKMYTDQRYNDKQNSIPPVSPLLQDAENPITESSKLLNTQSCSNLYSFPLPVVGSKDHNDIYKQALLGNHHEDFTRHGGNSTAQTGVERLLSLAGSHTSNDPFPNSGKTQSNSNQKAMNHENHVSTDQSHKNTFSCLALSYYLTYATVTSSVAAVVMTQLAYYDVITENKTSRLIELVSSSVFTLASLWYTQPKYAFAKYHLEDQQAITKKGCNKTANHTSASEPHENKNKKDNTCNTLMSWACAVSCGIDLTGIPSIASNCLVSEGVIADNNTNKIISLTGIAGIALLTCWSAERQVNLASKHLNNTTEESQSANKEPKGISREQLKSAIIACLQLFNITIGGSVSILRQTNNLYRLITNEEHDITSTIVKVPVFAVFTVLSMLSAYVTYRILSHENISNTAKHGSDCACCKKCNASAHAHGYGHGHSGLGH